MDDTVNLPATPTNLDSIEDDIPSDDDDFNYGAAPTTAPETSYFASTSPGSSKMTSDYSLNYDAPAASGAEHAYFSGNTQRPQMPRSIRDLGQVLNSKRRVTVQGPIRGAATAWIDQDDSGTYDPKAARATPPVTPPRRTKTLKAFHELEEDGNPKPRLTRPHRVGYSFPMTIVLMSEAGLDYLRSITPGPFNSEADDTLSMSLDPEKDSGYGSFSRRKTRRPRRLGEWSTREDGLTVDKLTWGHPQRRGCVACFEAGDDGCSLLEHSFDYPCSACEDADIDCELIIPPKLKKVCERCKKKRISCSYRDGGGIGVDSCGPCEEADATCCAGPLPDFTNSGRYDDVLSQPQLQRRVAVAPRQYVSCNECRMSGSRCSLKNKQQPGPCKNCRKEDHQCTFVLIPANAAAEAPVPKTKPTGRKKAAAAKRQVKRRHRASTPDQTGFDYISSPNALLTYNLGKEYSDRKRHGSKRKHTLLSHDPDAGGRRTKKQERLFEKGIQLSRCRSLSASPQLIGSTRGINHIFITTSFCHPIQFNYIPDPKGQYPCSWCDSPIFGLYGHEEKTNVECVPGRHGAGHEEVAGGHARNFPNSKMCITCTFSRIKIRTCPSHTITPLANIDPRTFDEESWEAAAQAIHNGDLDGGKLILSVKWCSICPQVAMFACATPQVFDGNGELVRDGEVVEGCGFLLCYDCEELWGKCIRGRLSDTAELLDAMVREVKNGQGWGYTAGVRADASFLTGEGELLVRMREGMCARDGETGAGAKDADAAGMGMGNGVLELSDSDDEDIGDEVLGEVLRRNKGRIRGGIQLGPLLSEVRARSGGNGGGGGTRAGSRTGKGKEKAKFLSAEIVELSDDADGFI